MGTAKSVGNKKTPIEPYNGYKVTGPIETILDRTQMLNFKDQYVLGEQLGWGRFGIIRACSDKLTGELLACKSIAKDRLVTQDDARSVKLEIEIMNKLSGHPNVVNLKAVYEEDDYVHLVMELCAGGELFHLLEKHGRFSENEARDIFTHLMQVVLYCHDKGIVHRDLKPENILLVTKSFSSPIKLADFGLATYIEPGEKLHGTVGSPFYIAPEVLLGGYNQAADVWSAGVILYILLSGMPPFWGKTKSEIFDAVRAADLQFPHNLWDGISTSAKDLITEMLSVDPCKRLTSAQVLAHSWMKDCAPATPYKQNSPNRGRLELSGESFSTPFIATDQDFSFSDGSPATPPVFTCRSSFSSFLVENGTPCSVIGGLSFSSCCETNAPEFSSPVPSMPSFTFLSPSFAVEPSDESSAVKAKTSTMDSTRRDLGLGRLFTMSDPFQSIKHHFGEIWQRAGGRPKGGGINGSRVVGGIHSKRNHTIGLGELEQLELGANDPVIRWASCTRIPIAPSLRLSLVC